MLPKRNKFQPEVHYKKDQDQIIIGEQALLPMSNPYINHDKPHVSHVPGPKNWEANEPEIPKKAGRVATAPVLGCDEIPSLGPVPSAPPAPNVGFKTIYTKPGSTTLSAGKNKKLNVVFDFPDRKSCKKN